MKPHLTNIVLLNLKVNDGVTSTFFVRTNANVDLIDDAFGRANDLQYLPKQMCEYSEYNLNTLQSDPTLDNFAELHTLAVKATRKLASDEDLVNLFMGLCKSVIHSVIEWEIIYPSEVNC